MSKLRKFLSIILAIAFIVPHVMVTAAENDTVDTLLFEAEQFISSLNLISTVKTNDEILTRGEFAGMIKEAFNLAEVSSDIIFTDVQQSSPNYDAIKTLAGLSYMKGDKIDDNIYSFYPDSKMLEADAVKVIADILGYSKIAAVKGAYPYNYLDVARSSGITRGISIAVTKELTVETLKKLIFRAYNSYAAKWMGVRNDELYIETERSTTYMEEALDITVVEGIVTSNSMINLYGGDPEGANFMRIDNTKYKMIYADRAVLYTGQYVKAYVVNNENVENEIVCIYPKPAANNAVTLKISEIDKVELLSQIKTEDEKYNISKDANVYLNFEYMGPVRMINLSSALIKAKFENALTNVSCEIAMVDSDYDEVFDFVWIRSYDNIMVSSYNSDELKIKDKFGTIYNIKEAYDANRLAVFENGKPVNIGVLAENSVISAIMNKNADGEIVQMYGIMSTESVEGKVTSIYESQGGYVTSNQYVIGDTAYYASKEYLALMNAGSSKVEKLKIGLSTVFYINEFGAIAGVNKNMTMDDGESYGFLIKAAPKDNFGSTIEVAVLTTSGTIENLDLAEMVKVNGSKYSGAKLYNKNASDAGIINKLSTKEKDEYTIVYKLCKYKMNDGKIASLEIEVGSEQDERLYAGITVGSNDGRTLNRYKNNTVGKQVGINGNTYMFEVPFASECEDALTDMETMKTISSNDMVADMVLGLTGQTSQAAGVGEMKFYDLTSTRFAKAAIRFIPFTPSGPVKKVPDTLENNVIISKISPAANKNGEEVYMITGYQNGVLKEFLTIPTNGLTGDAFWGQFWGSSEAMLYTKNGKIPVGSLQVGDVTHLYLNGKGEVANFFVNTRAMDKDTAGWYTPKSTDIIGAGQSIEYLSINYGEVIEAEDTTYLLSELDGQERVYLVPSATIVTVVNRKSKKVSMGALADIEIGSDIFIKAYYGNIKEVVLFKD